jgi:hypothetical protein
VSGLPEGSDNKAKACELDLQPELRAEILSEKS